MNKTFTKSIYIVSVIILFLTSALSNLVRANGKSTAGNLTAGKAKYRKFYVAPAAPTIDLLDFLHPETTSPNIVRYTDFFVQGSGPSGSTITLYIDNVALTRTYPLINKTIWAIENRAGDVTLANGTHTVKATATDVNGNVSAFSTVYTFIVNQTVLPNLTTPVITSPAVDAVTTSRPTFTGTGPSSSRIDFYIDEILTGSSTLNSSTTNWSFLAPSVLSNGYHTIQARAVDASNNVSDKSTEVRFVVNVVPVVSVNSMPATGVATLFGTASPAKSFNVKGTNLTSDILVQAPSNFEVSQTGTSGFASTTTIPLATAVGGGNVPVYFRLAANAPVGNYSSSEVVVNVGGGGAPIAVTLPASTVTDATPPTLSPVTIVSNNATTSLAKTGNIITLNFTSNKAINTPTVKIDTHTASVSNLGGNNWKATYTMTGTDPEGTVQFNIAFTDFATGVTGTPVTATTDNSSVTFDRTAPSIPAIITTEDPEISYDPSVSVNGTADVGSTINVYMDNVLLGSVTATTLTNGYNWSYPATGLSAGLHHATATATDAAGNVSTVSPAGNYNLNLSPTIFLSGPNSMSTPQGTASASQPFSVGGRNLTTGVTVTAPANFEISADNVNFTNQITVPLSAYNQISNTPAYVRLKATAPAGTYTNSYITGTSTGAADASVRITAGYVIGPPTLTSVSISSDNARNNLAKAGNKVTLSFTADQSLNTTTVSIAGHAVTPTSGRGNYRATYTLTAGDQEGIIPFSIAYNNDNLTPGVTATTTTDNTTVTFDNTPPSVPAIVNLADFQTSTSPTINVYGTAEVGSIVKLYLDDVLVNSIGTSALSDGHNWRSQLTLVAPGAHHITTTATDAAGNVSGISSPANFTVTITPFLGSNTNFQTLTTVYGTASASTFTNIVSSNVTDGILVTPPAGVEVSIDNVTFGTTATIPFSAATSTFTINGVTRGYIDQPVYIRLSATAPVGAYSDFVVFSTAGAADYKLRVSELAPPSVQSKVTGALLTIKANDVNKNYGDVLSSVTGSTNFTITAGTLKNSNIVSSVSIAYGTGSAANAPVSGTYTDQVTPSAAIGTNGFLASNYNITYDFGDIIVNKAPLTVTATGVNKVYDGTTTATVTFTDNRLSGDTFTTNYTAVFNNKNAGTAKPINVSGISITGGASANYTLSNPTTTTSADITALGLNVTAQTDTKVYDGTTSSSVVPVVGALQTGDAVGTAPTQTYDTKNVGTGKTLTAAGLVISDGNSGGNYTVTYITNTTGSITSRGLNVTAQTDTKVYDGTTSSSVVPVVGALQTGDAVGTAPTQTYDTKNVGTGKTLTAAGLVISDGNSGGNYTVTYITNTTGSITSRGLNVTAQTDTKVYDGTTSSSVAPVVGALQTGDAVGTAPTQTYDTKNVGTGKTLTAAGLVINDGNSGGNYTVTYVTNTTGSITSRGLNVTAQTDTKVYDGTTSSSVVPVVGALQTGDAVGTAPTQTYDTKNVGTGKTLTAAGLVISDGNSGGNYTVTYITNTTGSITSRGLNVTAQTDTKVYDGTTSSSVVPVVGALQTGDAVGTAPTQTYDTKNVGTGKTLTAAGLVINDGNSGGNYTVTYVTNTTGSITSRGLNVTAQTDTKVYDGTTSSSVVPVVGALQTGDAVGTAPTQTYDTKNVGTGKTLTAAGLVISDGNSGGNYTVTYITNTTGSITPKGIAVTADAQTKTYGDADPALTYAFTPALATGDSFTGSLSRVPGENIGTYAINQGSLELSTNYTLTYTGNTLVIGKKTIAVTADAQTKTYGDADPALTYAFTPALATGDSFTGSLSRVPGENIGTYAINQGSLALSTNYTLTYTGNTLVIGKKTITVTADAQTKTYGDADPALTYVFTPALVTGDSFSGSLVRVPGENIGTYAINQGSLALSTNYTLTYIGNNLVIGKKTISVTADAKTKTYGDADPALTYAFTPALVAGDSFSGSLVRVPGENVGTYAINQGSLVLNTNYTLAYTSNNLVITAKAIAVTADAKTKIYGDADPALTYTFTPALITGDSFTGGLSRTAGENVGDYAINQGSLQLSSNYTINYTGTNLSITKRAVAVTADAQTKVFGNADPALTYQISSGNLVTGDGFSGALSRTAGEAAGTYAINQGSLTLSGNYTLGYTGSTLTITAASTRTVTFTTLPAKTYGDADFAPGGTASTGETLLYSSSDASVASIVNGKIHIVGAGTATITATAPANNNYTGTLPVSEFLIVNKANQTISFGQIPQQMRGTSYDLSVVTTSAGLPVSFTTRDTMVATVTGSKLNAVGLGTTEVIASAQGNANYNAAVSVVQQLKVIDAAGPDDVIVHQTLSPNGDGINDVLQIEGIKDHPNNKVTVMTRNGVKVFEIKGYDNSSRGFDGHSNITGAALQQGTYFYLIEYTDENGLGRRKTGFFVYKF